MALTDDLVACYEFSSSGDAVDETGNYTVSSANVVGNPSYNSGDMLGGSWSFDGNDYFSTGIDYTDLNWTNACTIVFWFKTSNSSLQFPCGFTDEQGSHDPSIIPSLYRLTGEVLRVFIRSDNDSDEITTSSPDVDDDSYHMFTYTYDSSSGGKLYLDGGTTPVSTHSSITGNIDSDIPFYIGSFWNRNSAHPNGFIGEFAQFLIYSRAITGTENSELYNSGSGLAYPFSGGGSSTPDNNSLFHGVNA